MAAKNTPATINLDELDGELLDSELGGSEGDAQFEEVIDFGSVRGFETVDKGPYHLRLRSLKCSMSKQKLPMLVITTEIIEGEQTGVLSSFNMSLAPKAVGRTKAMLVGMGMPANAKWSPRQICVEMVDSEFYGILDVQQSDGINPATQQPYPKRNNLVATSQNPYDAPRSAGREPDQDDVL